MSCHKACSLAGMSSPPTEDSFLCSCLCLSFWQVSLVLSALQAGNKGTQACITAASAVSGIIADLDTTIMFATAGTLNAENNESFADHRSVWPRNWGWGGGG